VNGAVPRVALLTNPTSGKGRGARGRDAALDVLRGTDVEVLDLAGADADEALALAHAVVPDVDALVVCGGGLRITEGAVLDDGLLDVVVIKPMGKGELVRTYPRLFTGTHTTHPQYEHHRVRRVTVAAAGIVTYADGERFWPLPLTVECAPGALEVLTPA